jgi:hypothetical protein
VQDTRQKILLADDLIDTAQKIDQEIWVEDVSDKEEDECSSIVSEISTVKHDQELFETFPHKIRDLILQLYPQVCSEAIEIQSITGGSFNLIIGVRFPNACGRQQHNFLYKLRKLLAIRGNFNRTPTVSFEGFIMRIPRDSTVGLKYQVATLKYVETYIGYPVPQVVAFQPSPDKNPLTQGYMIQRRLAGQPLHQIWNNLTFGQKKRAVRQISQILINLNKVRNDSPGICSPSCKLESYPVPAFGISEPKFTKPHVFPSKPITTKDLLLCQCVRWSMSKPQPAVHGVKFGTALSL